jgi:hypothetical protein
VRIARKGESSNAYKIMAIKFEWKRPLERPRCRWKDNNNIDLKEISVFGCELDSSGSE